MKKEQIFNREHEYDFWEKGVGALIRREALIRDYTVVLFKYSLVSGKL